MAKPKCAVNGIVRPGVMCGSVIVGGKLCGNPGECRHQIIECETCSGRGEVGGFVNAESGYDAEQCPDCGGTGGMR